jgi:hypothetical protein
MAAGGITPGYDQQIRGTILNVRRMSGRSREMLDPIPRKPGRAFGPKIVILDESLDVATNAKTGPTKALATICDWNEEDEEYVETEEQIEVWNHSESDSYEIDTFGIAFPVGGHYFMLGDCGPMADRGD